MFISTDGLPLATLVWQQAHQAWQLSSTSVSLLNTPCTAVAIGEEGDVVMAPPTLLTHAQWDALFTVESKASHTADNLVSLFAHVSQPPLKSSAEPAPLVPVAFLAVHKQTQQLYKCILSHSVVLQEQHQQAETTYVLTMIPLCHEGLQTVQKNEFLSIVSHEFRTPLTSIQGFVDTLLGFSDRLSKEQHHHFLTIIKHQSERLSRLVERLLSLSKLEGSAAPLLKFRPVPLASLLNDVEAVLKGKHGLTHTITRQWQLPTELAILWGEPDALEQIFVNILDNAFKYSPQAQRIDVQISTPEADPSLLCVSITDYGIGLSEDHLKQLFNRFYRASHSLTQSIEGTGLGLYLTKQLIHQQHGRIEVSSQLSVGSTFRVYLPLATTERQQEYRSVINLP
jgi:signal transduction histidine kinase